MSSSGESYGHGSGAFPNSDGLSFVGDDSFTETFEPDTVLVPVQDDMEITTTRVKNGKNTTVRLSSMIPQTVQSLSRWPVIMESSPWAAYISQNSTPLAQTRTNDEAGIDGLEANPSPKISLKQCMTLVERYLNTSNMENPILDPIRLRPLVSQAYLSSFRLSIESCLALLVCANGAISTPFGSNSGPSHTADTALADTLFRYAEQRLGMAFTTGSVAGAQCLYLSGVFHMCKCVRQLVDFESKITLYRRCGCISLDPVANKLPQAAYGPSKPGRCITPPSAHRRNSHSSQTLHRHVQQDPTTSLSKSASTGLLGSRKAN